jgi:hypothetical protein
MAELIWDGKYDEHGNKRAPVRIELPFQTVETVNESRVPLDKSEGSVKGKDLLSSVGAPLALPERLRTKALEISR